MLPADQVYSVVAYVLHPGGIVGDDDVMDAKNLPQVKMPNRDGFVRDTRPGVGKYVNAMLRSLLSCLRVAAVLLAVSALAQQARQLTPQAIQHIQAGLQARQENRPGGRGPRIRNRGRLSAKRRRGPHESRDWRFGSRESTNAPKRLSKPPSASSRTWSPRARCWGWTR